MNTMTSMILWMVVQISLFSLCGAAAFLFLRRRGPNVATSCATTILLLTLPLAVLMVSPWPSWLNKSEISNLKSQTNLKHEIQTVETIAPASPVESDSANASTGASIATLSMWWQSVVSLLQPMVEPAVKSGYAAPSWQIWLPWILIIGMSFGFVRLLLGIWGVRRLRKNSSVVEDAGLLAEIERLEWQFQHTHPALSQKGRVLKAQRFEIRQSDLLRSAATIGWRKPTLLLPAEWRSWTPTERRTVLAHELAHIARCDYLTAILARLVTTIHFYQPLLLWLGRQLRIQQELAADAQAATVAGDRQTYLTTLAQMALRADEQPLPWVARAFLPGTSMLIKRVAWLKKASPKVEKSLSRAGRVAMLVCLMSIALGVAGIRGPQRSSSAVALAGDDRIDAKPAFDHPSSLIMLAQNTTSAPQIAAAPNIDRTFKYVPADAKMVAAFSPSELAKLPSGAKLFATFDAEFLRKHGFKLSDLADMELMCIQGDQHFDRVVLRTENAFDWKTTLAKFMIKMEIRNSHGQYYYADVDPTGKNRFGDFGPCFYLPDDHTLIAGTEKEIQTIIRGGENLMEASQFPEFGHQPIALRVDMQFFKTMIGLNKSPQQFEKNPAAAMFLPLIDHVGVERLGAEIKQKDTLAATATLECDSADGAQQVATTLGALKVLAVNLIKAKQFAWQQTESPATPQGQIAAIGQSFDLVIKTLDDAQIQADGKAALVKADVDLNTAVVADLVMPAVTASREASLRTQSMNNLKQLGLAMFMYNDVHKHFPAAAIRDKDGKPLLSWRVAILPYIEQESLYKEFRLDEPWDSEHNKALIAKMPAVFHDPHDLKDSTNASYFMPTGKGTFGDSESGTRVKEITDGAANTIMLVDAKRDIPWTKPEDIEIDADPSKPLPRLGGYFTNPDDFAAAFADGSVRYMSHAMDPKVLHALFTINGGELIKQEDLNPDINKPAAEQNKGAVPDTSRPAIAYPVGPAKDGVQPLLREVNGQPVKVEFELLETTMRLTDDGKKIFEQQSRPLDLNLNDIQEARLGVLEGGDRLISITMTPAGAKKMETITEKNIGNTLAIVVDGKAVLQPKIMSKLSEKLQLTGAFSKEEGQQIVDRLNGK